MQCELRQYSVNLSKTMYRLALVALALYTIKN